ncbi:hypothetical protein [Alteromonas sp. P256]|uniref:hypothetical protein n=1 Tax=Alteromonas sp. P256 TaxID=3117399 RepID=UPI002FE2C2B3|tara:strand:+ start:567 stop:791 length:225 start_codon:yes stop_codon:yes gene_type:complete
MNSIFAGVGAIGALFYLILILLWIAVPIFVFLISKRVKNIRDIGVEYGKELKELNASVKYLKRKYNESVDISKE